MLSAVCNTALPRATSLKMALVVQNKSDSFKGTFDGRRRGFLEDSRSTQLRELPPYTRAGQSTLFDHQTSSMLAEVCLENYCIHIV